MTKDKELLARQRRDIEDLKNEIAGRDVGRRARFLNSDARSPEMERKKREAQAFQNRLLEMLNDPIYRAKYESVMQALSDAEQATQAAIDALTDQIGTAQTELNDIMDNAARLPDGTRVFRDENGIVRQQDGTVVEDHLVDTILWNGHEPSFEDVHAARDRIDGLQGQLDAAHGYENDVLGTARDKITDPDNPPSLGDLDGILDNIHRSAPDAVKAQMSETPTAVQPELVLRRLLHAAGLRYGLHPKNLPGKPDIVLTRWKAVVFVHGCFWHRHAGCHWCTTPATNIEFWNAKFAKSVQRDRKCVHEFLGLGWRVATVWECALRGEEALRSADLIQDWLRSGHDQFETGITRPHV